MSGRVIELVDVFLELIVIESSLCKLETQDFSRLKDLGKEIIWRKERGGKKEK